MYIANQRGGYDRGGEAWGAGLFLIVLCSEERDENGHRKLKGLVRSVSMHQMGHFMMGETWIAGERYSLSGTYGSDGLPMSIESNSMAWKLAVPFPAELTEKFWKGGGHNSAGSEGPDVAGWARENLKALQNPCPVPYEEVKWGERTVKVLHKWVRCDGYPGDKYIGYAKPGNLVHYFRGNNATDQVYARVIGCVKEDGKDMLMVIELGMELSHGFVRLIDPQWVKSISSIPANLLAWIIQPNLPCTHDILKLDRQGSLSDNYISKYA